MPTASRVQTRSRTKLIAAVSGVLAAISAVGAAPPPASAGSVQAPLYDGVNRFQVGIPHVHGVRPPLIRYRTSPADARCRLTELSYVARADELDGRSAGRAALVVRCGNVPSGARVRLDAGPPLVRTVAIHNGDGRLDVRLDKPAGAVSPQVLLETAPRGRGSCRALSLHHRETRTVLSLRGRYRCSGLPRSARAVLSVGGVAAVSPAARNATNGPAPSNARASAAAVAAAAGGRRPSDARARRADAPPGGCGSVVSQPKSATELQMSQRLCVKPTETVTIAPYSLGLPSPVATSCPVSWLNTANLWPGFTYEVTPTDGWWEAGKDGFGGWRFNNSSPDVSRTLVLTWSCWAAAPGNTVLPTITGDAKVGGTLRCNPGTWSSPEVAEFDYVWVRRRGEGTSVIARGDTYTLTPAEARQSVACLVTAYTASGVALQPSVYSPTSDPVVDALPKVLKGPTVTVPELRGSGVGRTATCDPGEWDQARPKDPFTYEWQVGNTASRIPGENRAQIRIPDRVGAKLWCTVTAHNVIGATTVLSSNHLIIRQPGGQIL